MDKTNGDQVPWTEDGIQRRQRVLFGGENKVTPTQSPPLVLPPPARQSEAAEEWDRSKGTTSFAVLEAFITRYKDTFYADLARARIEDLKKAQADAAARAGEAREVEAKRRTEKVKAAEVLSLVASSS